MIKMPPVEANSQRPVFLPGGAKTLEPALREPVASTIMSLPRAEAEAAMRMAALPPSARMSAHCHGALQLPLPAAAAFRPATLPIRPLPEAAGLERLHRPLMAFNPLSEAAISMNRFSVSERVAAALAAYAASAARPDVYPYYSPYGDDIAPLSLPTPHQAKSAHINTKNFPETLFDVISQQEHTHIISWLAHGRGFIIHDKQRFGSMILPRYFDGAKFTSFTRRLKRWNFVRVPRGPELGAYYNKNFERDQLELVQNMRYRVEGQFEDFKNKSGEDTTNKQKEKLEEQIEKEFKAKVQLSLPEKRDQAQKNETPRPSSYEKKPYLSATIHNPEAQGASHDAKVQQHMHVSSKTNTSVAYSMSLPSMLPKEPKAPMKTATAQGSTNPIRVASSESIRNYPTRTTESSLLPPNLVSPDDHEELMVQGELLLARSMLSHEVAARTASATSTPRFMDSSSLSSYPYHIPNTTQRILEVEHAERVLGLTGSSSGGHHRTPTAATSSETHNEIVDAAVRDMQTGLNSGEQLKNPMSYNHHLAEISWGELSTNYLYGARRAIGEVSRGLDRAGGRAVMMSRAEEEEFARYLFLKRTNSKNSLDV